MLRNAETKSCSLTTSSPVAVNSTCAGEVVPQYGQISACLAGFQSASAPQAGDEKFLGAAASGMAIICYQPTLGGVIWPRGGGRGKKQKRRDCCPWETRPRR